MFGYATDETEECMPLTVVLAHALNKKISDMRRSGDLWWARPDTKTQVTCEYIRDNGACIPQRYVSRTRPMSGYLATIFVLPGYKCHNFCLVWQVSCSVVCLATLQ